MKRKQPTLFMWNGQKRRGRPRPFGADPESDSEPDTEVAGVRAPQMELLFKEVKIDENKLVQLPCEMLLKIFHYVINLSDDPIWELCNLAKVCESWRGVVIQSPTLWKHLNFLHIPTTDRNLLILSKILNDESKVNRYVKTVAFSGPIICKNSKVVSFVESLLVATSLEALKFHSFKSSSRLSAPTICKLVRRAKNLRALSINYSRILFNNQKWLSDHLIENGHQLEILDLAMSLTQVPTQLFRAIGSSYCPKLKFLDLSTCEVLNTRSFDAVTLSQELPNLQHVRLANVSFKRVHQAPENKGLKYLRELSIPISMRDADRDDALFATLAHGSFFIDRLDLRGSSISPYALLTMPSDSVRELHMDDLCPIYRGQYKEVIARWSPCLERLSLIKINSPTTMKECLMALVGVKGRAVVIKEVDLTGSDVDTKDLKKFLDLAKTSLERLTLSSCRSLPRGCKGLFELKPTSCTTQSLKDLSKKLK